MKTHKLIIRQDGESRKVPFSGTPLLSRVLDEHGYSQPHPCGGRGICGQCRVELGTYPRPTGEARAEAGLRARPCSWATAKPSCPQSGIWNRSNWRARTAGQAPAHAGHYGAAIDVGTTTLALKVFDLYRHA